jgi:hypothetical protein
MIHHTKTRIFLKSTVLGLLIAVLGIGPLPLRAQETPEQRSPQDSDEFGPEIAADLGSDRNVEQDSNILSQEPRLETPHPMGLPRLIPIIHPGPHVYKSGEDDFRVLVTVNMNSPSGRRYVETKLAEMRSQLRAKGLPESALTVEYVPQDMVEEVAKEYARIAETAKKEIRNGRHEKMIDAATQAAADTVMGRAVDYAKSLTGFNLVKKIIKKAYVPVTREQVVRGILIGAFFQASISVLSDVIRSGMNFNDISVVRAAFIAAYGGLFGIYHPTIRNIFHDPDEPGPTYLKMYGNSVFFSMSVSVLQGTMDLALILGNAIQAQFSKVYWAKWLRFKEKYGTLSDSQSFYSSQIGLVGLTILFRMWHLEGIPYLGEGMKLMAVTGFLVYLGHKVYLAAGKRDGFRYYALVDERNQSFVLTQSPRDFSLKYLYQLGYDPNKTYTRLEIAAMVVYFETTSMVRSLVNAFSKPLQFVMNYCKKTFLPSSPKPGI